ncbi:hypothetical protein C7999DRAFT_41439 [Corynascus novoguineensis]|uniref:Uncharacterized protein n=1 Tax=Corynascus novoguineensis TaxID=1126955 RepID=A0AAN7CRX8_9PEZI|nr:hypothetical protein C7999DRAFT_41439 [Corynascus novoguineensis]
MDYSTWPELLPTVLARIEKIARTEFSIPAIPPTNQPARPPSLRFVAPLPSSDPFEATGQAETSSSQGTNKENADPSSPLASRDASSATASSGTAQQPTTDAGLPKPIADMLDEILNVLRNNFSQYPPHTIQRLSELVLRPRQHYRHLVPYLHALDRVVHVTSGANIYPLPPALPDVGAMSLLANGAGSGGGAGDLSIDTAAANTLGSDEALGGALLTPIPWLASRTNGDGSDDDSEGEGSSPLSANGNPAQQFQLQQQQQRQSGHLEGRVRTESTETIEGPNGIGSIETVSVSVNGIPSTGAGVALLTQRSVTQGELLRQEQRAGLVPLNQLSRQQQQQQQQQHHHQQQLHQVQDNSTSTSGEDATMTDGPDGQDRGDDDEEVPHARGPGEIGPADTGPQSAATANYIAGAGGSPMDVQEIDVAAAVGRSVQNPPTARQERGDSASASPDASEVVPRSPKREAGDQLEPESPSKRRKEDEPSPAAVSTSQGRERREQRKAAEQQHTVALGNNRNRNSNNPAATTSDKAVAEPKPSRDAEGDVVLSDADAADPRKENLPQAEDSAGDSKGTAEVVDSAVAQDKAATGGGGGNGSPSTAKQDAEKQTGG